MSSHSASLQELRSFGESAALLARLNAAELGAFVARSALLYSFGGLREDSTLSVVCDRFGSAVCLNPGHSSLARIPFRKVARGGSPFPGTKNSFVCLFVWVTPQKLSLYAGQ